MRPGAPGVFSWPPSTLDHVEERWISDLQVTYGGAVFGDPAVLESVIPEVLGSG